MAAAKKPDLPKAVKLIAPHGFHDDEKHHYWQQGQIVTNEDEIALLIERGAPIVVIDELEVEVYLQPKIQKIQIDPSIM